MPRLAPARRLTVVEKALAQHVERLAECTRCRAVIGPVVTPPPVVSTVYLLGQAPGRHEGELGRPFAWTAGKTLFQWFAGIGLREDEFRARVYMAAVCRCFPGKTRGGGDRVPTADEVAACSTWMEDEIRLLAPRLVIPVGRLAITRVLGPAASLSKVVGRQQRASVAGHACDVIALPHPSGASSWFKTQPGKTLLARALATLSSHSAWQALRQLD